MQSTYRVKISGNDASGLGRWSWIQLDGKDNIRTQIITAYRPCKAPATSGLTTTWDQHVQYIQNKGLHTDPLTQFDTDLSTLLTNWRDEGIRIILVLKI